MRRSACAAALLFGLGFAAACNPLGLPATRELERGAEATLAATSFEMSGVYSVGGSGWTLDAQLEKPDRRHLVAASGGQQVEAIVLGPIGYFRGRDFLVSRLAGNPLAPNLIAATGSSWWKGPSGLTPALQDFTDGTTLRSTFLGTSATTRTDDQIVDGVYAVELSGARADVYIASAPPYELLRVHMKKDVTVDGIEGADFKYRNVNQQFGIVAPTDVVDFSNFSTLPPIYTVVSVDTSGCGSPCVVSALLKNLGGAVPAAGPSTVTFTMTDPVSGRVLGTCSVAVRPDVGYNATTTVTCNINAQPTNAAIVTAVVDNPGRG